MLIKSVGVVLYIVFGIPLPNQPLKLVLELETLLCVITLVLMEFVVYV